jgi:hypothetical protein
VFYKSFEKNYQQVILLTVASFASVYSFLLLRVSTTTVHASPAHAIAIKYH